MELGSFKTIDILPETGPKVKFKVFHNYLIFQDNFRIFGTFAAPN